MVALSILCPGGFFTRSTPSFAVLATLLVGCGGGPSALTPPPGPAAGPGSALIYPPGNFASTDELIAISSAVAPFGGVYLTLMRSEADNFLEAIDEAIKIGSQAGVPVEIYHLKAGGTANWHKAAEAIAKIDSARVAGVDIQANMYPYTACSADTCANKVRPPSKRRCERCPRRSPHASTSRTAAC